MFTYLYCLDTKPLVFFWNKDRFLRKERNPPTTDVHWDSRVSIYLIVLKPHVLTQMDFSSTKTTSGTTYEEKKLKIPMYLWTQSESNQQ